MNLDDSQLPSLNGTINSITEDVTQCTKRAEEFIDKTLTRQKEAIQEKTQAKKQLEQTIELLRQKIEKTEKETEYYQTELPRLKEQLIEEEARDQQLIEEYSVKEKALEEKRKEHQAIKQKVASKHEVLNVRKLGEQRRRNALELEAYIKYTGLTIQPLRENCLKFSFTLIDKQHPEKVFYFVLSLGPFQDMNIKVLECEPMLSDLTDLVTDLHRHQDIHHFVRQMRQAFSRSVSSSVSSTSSASSTLSSPASVSSILSVSSPELGSTS